MSEPNMQKIQSLEAEIESIDQHLAAVRGSRNQRNVDFVDFGDIGLFMLTHDNLYDRFIPDSKKNQSVRDYIANSKKNGFPKPIIGKCLNSLFYHVVSHLAENRAELTVLDVGCHAGSFGMRLANHMRHSGIKGKVALFDIGLISELVPKNIAVNDLDGIARFEKLAVSNNPGPVTVYHNPGHSDSDNIFHQDSETSISYAAEAVRLSDYIQGKKLDNGSLIIKLDTEGLEPLIIKDINHILKKQKTIIVFEFTPTHFDTQETASDFIKQLLNDFLLFDIFYAIHPTRFFNINTENMANFIPYVENSEYGYTDVLCIPKKLIGLNHLQARLNGLQRIQDNVYRIVMDADDNLPVLPPGRSYLDLMNDFKKSGAISPLYERFSKASGLPLPDSIKDLEAVLSLDQGNPKAGQNLREEIKRTVKEAMNLGKLEASSLLLQRFPEEQAADGEWHFLTAQCLHQQKTDLERALHDYNLALDLGYFGPGVRLHRGILLSQLDRIEEVQADLELAIPAFSNEVTKDAREILKNIYRSRAREFVKNENLDAARSMLQKALSLAPDDPNLLNEHAAISSQLEDFTAAQREFVRATVLDPNNSEAHLKLADTLFLLGRARNAESMVRRVLDMDPFNENAIKLFNNLHNRHNPGGSGAVQSARLPKVSIVTPSFNCERYIRNCIESVLAQNYPNFEHIIIDGASKDGTVEILKAYPHLKWISEPDRGECEALNKALRMATGDIIGWLNADDCYEKRILPKVVDEMTTFGGADLIYGKTVFIDENGNPTQWVMPTAPINLITLTRWYNLNLFQPSIFFSRRLFEMVGFFREDLQYGIDYEYWFRIASKGFQFRYMDQVLSRAMIYRSDGKTGAPYAVKAQEWLEICYSYQRFLTYGERLHFWKDFFIFRLQNADTYYKDVPLKVPNRPEAFIGLLMAEKEVTGMNPDHFNRRIASNVLPDKADALGFLAEALRNAGNEAEAAKAFEWALDLNHSELLSPGK